MPNESAALQAKLALTDYRVLSVSKESPRRCSLMQLVAVTGMIIILNHFSVHIIPT